MRVVETPVLEIELDEEGPADIPHREAPDEVARLIDRHITVPPSELGKD